MTEHVDVLVVGAGLSGIAAGYHLQRELPGKRYAILESREAIGGTWDLFRYPGIRSDSDMYTLGYSFEPWPGDKAIADGASILAYVRDTAARHGIDRRIRFRHAVARAAWSTGAARWTVEGTQGERAEPFRMTCSFLVMCSGYYDYEQGHSPEFPGAADFRGRIVHPQKWTDDIDYTQKRVVVIGSGATAVTMLPSLAERAAHVTMLQRTPTYILSRPSVDAMALWMRDRLPPAVAARAARWKNVLLGTLIYQFCRRFPERARDMLTRGVQQQLGPDYDVATHFTPPYKPWDQRMCLVPEGDFFRSIKEGRVEVVTDRVERFTETGILLGTGRHLDADLIVTATGLRMRFLGGVQMTVDGVALDPPAHHMYRGTLLSGVPNLGMVLGYTNASWTLKAELILQYLCRLIAHADAKGRPIIVARCTGDVGDEPLMDLSAGYVQRALPTMPRQGSRSPWKLYQNYVRDLLLLRHGRLDDGALRFERAELP